MATFLTPYKHSVGYLYLWSFVVALGLLTLLWGVFSYVTQIKFGQQQMTRLTAVPYMVLWMGLASMAIEGFLLGGCF